MRMVVNVPLGLQRACMAIALSSTIVMQPLPPAFAATPTTDCNGNTPCAERTIDFGSCGNACCAIEYSFKGSTEATTTALKKVLRDGGPDARYTLPPLEGGQAGFADLRQYGVPADFLGQVVHTTKDRNFRDTINLAVRPGVDGKGSSVRAFSSSNIGGALIDQGQNYRNIEQIFEAPSVQALTSSPAGGRIIFGCGK